MTLYPKKSTSKPYPDDRQHGFPSKPSCQSPAPCASTLRALEAGDVCDQKDVGASDPWSRFRVEWLTATINGRSEGSCKHSELRLKIERDLLSYLMLMVAPLRFICCAKKKERNRR